MDGVIAGIASFASLFFPLLFVAVPFVLVFWLPLRNARAAIRGHEAALVRLNKLATEERIEAQQLEAAAWKKRVDDAHAQVEVWRKALDGIQAERDQAQRIAADALTADALSKGHVRWPAPTILPVLLWEKRRYQGTVTQNLNDVGSDLRSAVGSDVTDVSLTFEASFRGVTSPVKDTFDGSVERVLRDLGSNIRIAKRQDGSPLFPPVDDPPYIVPMEFSLTVQRTLPPIDTIPIREVVVLTTRTRVVEIEKIVEREPSVKLTEDEKLRRRAQIEVGLLEASALGLGDLPVITARERLRSRLVPQASHVGACIPGTCPDCDALEHAELCFGANGGCNCGAAERRQSTLVSVANVANSDTAKFFAPPREPDDGKDLAPRWDGDDS